MAERNYSTDFNTDTRVFTKTFKDGDQITLDFNALPAVAQLYVIGYGITQVSNDCHAGEKDLDSIKRISQQKVDDLLAGVIRARRGEGLGLGVDFDTLVKAIAEVKGAPESAIRGKLEKFLPSDEDDEDRIKAKKAHLRKLRNKGAIKAVIERMQGKDKVTDDDLDLDI